MVKQDEYVRFYFHLYRAYYIIIEDQKGASKAFTQKEQVSKLITSTYYKAFNITHQHARSTEPGTNQGLFKTAV